MLLALNTSTPQFGLALLNEDGTILAEYFISKEKGFGSLMPTLRFFISKLNKRIQDLKAVSVAIGPGSFTGLRVGISAAKGLCHGLEIPIIGISSLEALAAQMLYSELPVTPVLYSRKNEVYTAQFTLDKDGDTTRCMADAALRIEDLPLIFKDPSLFIGNDYANQGPAVIEVLGPMALLAPAHCWNLRASTIGALGLKHLHVQDFDDPLTLDPLYLRPPDIRPNPFPVMADSQGPGNAEK